jgi:hypothetical protein
VTKSSSCPWGPFQVHKSGQSPCRRVSRDGRVGTQRLKPKPVAVPDDGRSRAFSVPASLKQQNGEVLSLLSHNGTVYRLVLGRPPPPLSVQNLENKRSILRLCARSLRLQELHAKSREHGSYAEVEVPFWNQASIFWSRVRKPQSSPRSDCQRSNIILQIMYVVLGYPILRRAVNDKMHCGTDVSGGCAEMRLWTLTLDRVCLKTRE